MECSKKATYICPINNDNNMNTPCINSVNQMSLIEIKTLISQLEDAMLSNLSFEQKSKLNILIGKCIDIYMLKK